MNGTKAQPSATVPPPPLKTQGKMEVKDTHAPTPVKSNDTMEKEELPTSTVSKKEFEKEPTPAAAGARQGQIALARQSLPLRQR